MSTEGGEELMAEGEVVKDIVMDEEEKVVDATDKSQCSPEKLKTVSKPLATPHDSENDSPKITRRTTKPQSRSYASEDDFENVDPENNKTPGMPQAGRKSRTAKTPVSHSRPATAGSGKTTSSCSSSAAATTGAVAAAGNATRSSARTPLPGRGKRSRAGYSPSPDNSPEAGTSSARSTPASNKRTPSSARSSKRWVGKSDFCKKFNIFPTRRMPQGDLFTAKKLQGCIFFCLTPQKYGQITGWGKKMIERE